MNLSIDVLNVKQGIIDENNMAWGNLTYVDETIKDSPNAFGRDIAKMSVEPEFAKKLISDKVTGQTLLSAKMGVRAGKADLQIIGYGTTK